MDSQQAVGRPAARTGVRVARMLRGGTEANARLTALTGLVLLLVAGLTLAIAALPAVGPWLHWAGSDH
jgi:Na+-driven multidrug efflux pump